MRDTDYSKYSLILKITINNHDKSKVLEAIEQLKKREDVKSAGTNMLFHINSTTNDTYAPNQWYLSKVGYFDALDYAVNTETVKVGVIDTGIDSSNPDLTESINYDLSRSYVDTYPYSDYLDHGTCVAGIIGAQTNNGIGISGLCPNVELISLKASNYSQVEQSAIGSALEFAKENGIPIVNISSSGGIAMVQGYESNYAEALERYGQYNGLIVCSAGNDSTDIDNNENKIIIPAELPLDNIITVASVNSNDNFEGTGTNYGSTSVDLAAPGLNNLTTSNNINQRYRGFSGTSAAAPVVTGVAALVKSIHPDITVSQLKSFILNNVETKSFLNGKVATGGVINANKILTNISSKKFTVKYYPNGGSGTTMYDTTVYYGVNKKLSANTYSKLDYRFVGWTAYREHLGQWLYTSQNGNNGWYAEGEQPEGYVKFKYNDRAPIAKTTNWNNDVVKMYAQWESYQLGDVDLNGMVTVSDATLLQKYLAGIESLNEQQLRLADVTQDGDITISDVTEILRII